MGQQQVGKQPVHHTQFPISISEGAGWKQGMAVYACQGLSRI